MELSAEIIKKSIEPGCVVAFVNPKFPSDLPHLYVVLNDPSTLEIFLVMVNFTSQISSRKKARRFLPPSTLVELDNRDCSFLTKKSIIDCNSYSRMTIDELVEKNSKSELRLIDNVNNQILQRLKNGLITSPVIPLELKKLVDINYK